MRVVLLHDWITGFRGGERVLEVFCEMFPDAPVYTLFYTPGSSSKIIENRPIYSSFLNKLPGVHRNYRKLLPLFPLAVRNLKIKERPELILSGSHCLIKGMEKPEGAKHLCYIHSPMRYMYDQYDVYFGKDSPLLHRIGARIAKNGLVRFDLRSNENVDQFIANSHFVAQRVKKYYKREAQVIHPFVDLVDFTDAYKKFTKKDYFLMVTAFAPNKRVDLAIQSFNKLNIPLKIIGSGQQIDYLKHISKENIEFLGALSRAEVVQHMAQAKAFIFPGVEDFGITPLESLAAGTPVIAYKAGGALETLDESVAQFFSEPTEMALTQAVLGFEKRHFDTEKMLQRANQFSKEKFKKEISLAIRNMLQ